MHRQNPSDYETRPLFHRARDLKGTYNEVAPIPGEVVTSEAADQSWARLSFGSILARIISVFAVGHALRS